MASYEVEHNISANSSGTPPHRTRPDMSTFFAALSAISTTPSTSHSEPHNNPHAVPTPPSISAVYTLLAQSYNLYQNPEPAAAANARAPAGHDTLADMIESLLAGADSPPKEVKGVDQEFLDALERVPKKKLGDEKCPICSERFKDDPYPLVVCLPCHPRHWFDLECVGAWLKLQGTCPLDRKDLVKKKAPVPVVKDDEEEDWDDMVA